MVGYCWIWDIRGGPTTGNFVNVVTTQLQRIAAQAQLTIDELIQFCSLAFRNVFSIPPVPPVTPPITPPLAEVIIMGEEELASIPERAAPAD